MFAINKIVLREILIIQNVERFERIGPVEDQRPNKYDRSQQNINFFRTNVVENVKSISANDKCDFLI